MFKVHTSVGPVDIYSIDNAYGDSPPPHVFCTWRKSQGEEMSATFLDVRGRPCALLIVLVGVGEPGEPEKKRARGRSCLALDLLRHGLAGYVFSRV